MSAVIPVALQQRMCHSKRVYLAPGTADAIAARRQARKRGLKLRSYQCPNCGFWHLTKTPLKGASRPTSRPRMTRSTTRST